MKPILLTLVVIINLIGLSLSSHGQTREYSKRSEPKTTLELKDDGTFEFSGAYQLPLLKPENLIPDEKYFVTKGIWKPVSDNYITLTSIPYNSPLSEKYEVSIESNSSTGVSTFVFFNQTHDTIPISYVMHSDSTITLFTHGRMPYYSTDLTKNDRLEFHFYGYEPWIINKGAETGSYSVTLKPEIKSDYFRDAKFRITDNMVIDEATNLALNENEYRNHSIRILAINNGDAEDSIAAADIYSSFTKIISETGRFTIIEPIGSNGKRILTVQEGAFEQNELPRKYNEGAQLLLIASVENVLSTHDEGVYKTLVDYRVKLLNTTTGEIIASSVFSGTNKPESSIRPHRSGIALSKKVYEAKETVKAASNSVGLAVKSTTKIIKPQSIRDAIRATFDDVNPWIRYIITKLK